MSSVDQKNKSILLVDDDKFIVDVFNIKFSEAGFDFHCAFSGPEAISILEQGLNPDVIMTNIMMPGIDGFQMIKEIKEKGLATDSLIIILSNMGQEDDIKRATSLGVNGYITKGSSTPSEVLEKVSALIRKKQEEE